MERNQTDADAAILGMGKLKLKGADAAASRGWVILRKLQLMQHLANF